MIFFRPLRMTNLKNDPFLQRKSSLFSNFCDHSIKKSIDKPIEEIFNLLNTHPEYFTTSSCSGRIVVYNEGRSNKDDSEIDPWLLISHEEISFEQLKSSLSSYLEKHTLANFVSFKFEPMVMHVEARSLEGAQKLLSIAVQSGFRNSGISLSSKRIIVAIRCTLKLDVPIIYSQEGNCLLNDTYLEKLSLIANEKMKANIQLINRLLSNLKNHLTPQDK
jgi:tRNA wybutosine-synthesizing protein 3